MERQNAVPILPNNASQNCAASAISPAITKASNFNVSLVSPSTIENVLDNVNNEIKYLENYVQHWKKFQ